jgi:hypothetical protein
MENLLSLGGWRGRPFSKASNSSSSRAGRQKFNEDLPGHICQKASADVVFAKSLTSPTHGP